MKIIGLAAGNVELIKSKNMHSNGTPSTHTTTTATKATIIYSTATNTTVAINTKGIRVKFFLL